MQTYFRKNTWGPLHCFPTNIFWISQDHQLGVIFRKTQFENPSWIGEDLKLWDIIKKRSKDPHKPLMIKERPASQRKEKKYTDEEIKVVQTNVKAKKLLISVSLLHKISTISSFFFHVLINVNFKYYIQLCRNNSFTQTEIVKQFRAFKQLVVLGSMKNDHLRM